MKKNLQNKNVVAYCRVSTKDQKDFGNSLTVQNNRILEFCKSQEMNILKIFSEDYSAKDFNRPSFSVNRFLSFLLSVLLHFSMDNIVLSFCQLLRFSVSQLV